MRKRVAVCCAAVLVLTAGALAGGLERKAPAGVSIDNIDKAVELFSESRRAKLKGKTLISSKKDTQAKAVLRKEFPVGKVIATNDYCKLIKRGNRELRLSCYLTYKPLNKEMVFMFHSTVDKTAGIAREDITRDEIVESIENGAEEDALFSTERPGTVYDAKIMIIRYAHGITDSCALKTNPNTDEAVVRVHCKVLSLKEAGPVVKEASGDEGDDGRSPDEPEGAGDR